MNKKQQIISSIIISATAIGGIMALQINNGNIKGLSLIAESNVIWKHYAEVPATYARHGSREFWANCTVLGFTLEEPTTGTIEEGDNFYYTSYFDELDENDARYINPLPLEGGEVSKEIWDKYMTHEGLCLYSNTHIDLDYRVDGELQMASSFDFADKKARIEGYWPSSINPGPFVGYASFEIGVDTWSISFRRETYDHNDEKANLFFLSWAGQYGLFEFAFDDFTFDNETKLYHNPTFDVLGNGTYVDVKAAFQNNKPVYCIMAMTSGGTTGVVTRTYSNIGTTTVVIPD